MQHACLPLPELDEEHRPHGHEHRIEHGQRVVHHVRDLIGLIHQTEFIAVANNLIFSPTYFCVEATFAQTLDVTVHLIRTRQTHGQIGHILADVVTEYERLLSMLEIEQKSERTKHKGTMYRDILTSECRARL